MNTYVTGIVLAAYVSLIIELVLLHVPSVASNLKILVADKDVVAGYSSKYRAVFSYSLPVKILLFLLPVIVVWLLFLFPLLVIICCPDPLTDYMYLPGIWAQLAGASLVISGRAMTIWSVLGIRSANNSSRDLSVLTMSGVFRWSRNPGLLGMFMLIAGLWIIMPSITMAAAVLIYIAHMDFKVRMEEDFLSNRFGEAFDDYRSRTRRYL